LYNIRLISSMWFNRILTLCTWTT